MTASTGNSVSGHHTQGTRTLVDSVIERAAVALCVVGPGGEVLRANRRWLGAARDTDVVGRDVLAPFPRTWRVRALLARARRGETVALPPLRRGGLAWHGTAVPLPVAGGGGVLITLCEPVETRGAAPPRRGPPHGRPADEPVRAVADALPHIVCALAPDGTPEYVNRAWMEYSGLDLAASVEKGWLGVVHPDDVAVLNDTWRRARQSGKPEEVELRYRAADGSYRWFLSRLAPITGPDGRVVRWIGGGIEIDERKRAEAERERLLAQVEAADRRKTEFLGVLSHELRNPLAPLRNAAYVLEHAPSDGDRARAAIGVVSRQVDQLARLVEDLLDVTRIARGKIELRRRKVDLAAVACRTAEDHRALLAGRGVALEIVAPSQPAWVSADETRIAQVIGNLVGNAAKFTDAGGRVIVSVGEEGSRAVVRVTDTGIGIDPAQLGRVFEPFVQGEAQRTRGGLGLGLALVKGIVELHGGTVEARSEGPGRGASFTVALPVLAGDEPRAPTPVPAHVWPARRVLVVEDNRDAAEMLRLVLELDGHEVEVAHDAACGLERTRALLPDVVLCDIGLPDRDGYALATEIRAIPELAGVRLVALTGHAMPEDQRRAAEAGFDAHVGKPVSPEELERVLHALGPSDP